MLNFVDCVSIEDANVTDLRRYGELQDGGLERDLNEAITKICDMARQTLVRTVIAQAISLGFVTREHPESPRHPRQRYLLTTKGLQVLDELMSTNGKSKI